MSSSQLAERGKKALSRASVIVAVAQALRSYQSALDAFDEAVGERLGLNRTDLRCLDLVNQHEALSPGALAEKSGLTTGAITFVLDRLERAGYIERRRDPNDRRRVVVEMEKERSEEAWRLHEPLVRDMRKLAERFGIEELVVIASFLSAARELYEQHAKLLRQLKSSRRR